MASQTTTLAELLPDLPEFDMNALNGHELHSVEDLARQSIATFGDENFPQIKITYALSFVWFRKHGGTGTYNSYLSEPFSDIQRAIGIAEDDTDPADHLGDETGDHDSERQAITAAEWRPDDGAQDSQ